MPKRRPTKSQLTLHATAIAQQAEGNLGIASSILIPIILSVITQLLPVLMNCGQDKTPAERLGYDAKSGTFSKSAKKRAVAQVKRSSREHGYKGVNAMTAYEIDHLADLALLEAVRPTTNLTACAAECAAV